MEKSSKKADKNRFLDYALRAPLEMTKWDALQPSPHFSVARGVPDPSPHFTVARGDPEANHLA